MKGKGLHLDQVWMAKGARSGRWEVNQAELAILIHRADFPLHLRQVSVCANYCLLTGTDKLALAAGTATGQGCAPQGADVIPFPSVMV
jgi:hypothetical protein